MTGKYQGATGKLTNEDKDVEKEYTYSITR